MSTQLSVIPQGTQLPAHLQGPDAAAAIAAANSAASGGIKTGGFPRISIKGGKFHEKDGGETKTYFMPALPGQPALPMMCLEAVVVAANPALTKLYYPGTYTEGDDKEPACSSSNGVTPDPHIAAPQNSVCATCPQNQWGSKVSAMSGKDIKACDDNKNLAVLPVGDLAYKALGLTITKAALTDWGKYVKTLSERGIPVDSIVTNLTFDATASFPKLQFAYNRFLTAEEYAKVKERQQGDDVKLIVAQSRAAAPLALAAPAPAAPPIPASHVPPVQPTTPPPAPVQTGVVFPPTAASFGAVPQPAAAQTTGNPVIQTPAPSTPAATPTESPKRKRRTRAEMEADAKAATNPDKVSGFDPLAHLDAATRATIAVVGIDSVAGKAILAAFPPPVQDPLAHLDAATKATIAAVGGPDSATGKAILAAFQTAAAQGVRSDGTQSVAGPQPAFAPAAAPLTPPATVGFGAAPALQPVVASAGPSAAVMNLKALLEKKLGINQRAAG